MNSHFISHHHLEFPLTAHALWFILQNDQIVLESQHTTLSIPYFHDINQYCFTISRQLYLGTYKGTPCFAIEIVKSSTIPEHMQLKPLRQAFNDLTEDLFTLAGRAKQILSWDKVTQFCGRCGKKTQLSETERAKICPRCHLTVYPTISPAIITLVNREKEMLLARGPHFLPGIYSTIAGFIEPGETAEYAVEREVMEETSIQIKNIRYAGSQPWPFPHNLMLGFYAEYAGGDIKIDAKEIEDAKWFSLDNLPQLPNKGSIARQLIDGFIASLKL